MFMYVSMYFIIWRGKYVLLFEVWVKFNLMDCHSFPYHCLFLQQGNRVDITRTNPGMQIDSKSNFIWTSQEAKLNILKDNITTIIFNKGVLAMPCMAYD